MKEERAKGKATETTNKQIVVNKLIYIIFCKKLHGRLLSLALAAAISTLLRKMVVVDVFRFASTANCTNSGYVRACATWTRRRMREVSAELRIEANVVVRKLAKLRIVDTKDFCLLVAAQAETGDVVHEPEDDRRHDNRI